MGHLTPHSCHRGFKQHTGGYSKRGQPSEDSHWQVPGCCGLDSGQLHRTALCSYEPEELCNVLAAQTFVYSRFTWKSAIPTYSCTSHRFCGSPRSKVLRCVLLGDLHCSDLSSSCSLVPSGIERGVCGKRRGKALCQFNTELALSVGLFMVRSLLRSFECTQLTGQLVRTMLNLDFKHSVCVKLESDTEIPYFIILTRQLCAAYV